MNIQKVNPLNRSVAVRTTVMMLGLVIVIMLVSGLWQMKYTGKVISREMHRQASRSMDNAVKNIDNRISNVETALQTAASYANLFANDQQQSYILLQRLVEANEDVSAVTLMYRANYFKDHGKYFAPTVYFDTNDNKCHQDEIGGPQHQFDYLKSDSNWVYSNKLDGGYWSLPYLDSISTHRAMVSYSVPLHDSQGNIYAVLCADVELNWIKKIVEETKPFEYSEVFVMSRDSQYLCHPDMKWVQSINAISYAKQLNNAHYLELTRRMLKGEKGIDTLDKLITHLNQSDADQKPSKSIIYYAPIDRVQWSICFTIPEHKIMERPNKLRSIMLLVLICVLILISTVLYLILHYQLRPLKQLSLSASEIAKGNFNAKLPAIYTPDEIGQLRQSFEDMQHSLSSYVEELKATTASKASMESELRIASNIQMAMIPKVFPPFPDRDDIDVYGMLKPAKEVGGDLFDFFIRNEKLFFCIGDVSGKGVPASLLMAVTRSLFRNISAHESTPDNIVTHINETMSQNNEAMMFVTLFVGVLDLPTGKLRFCNAGHNHPILIGRNCDILPCEPNIPIGVMAGWKYKTQHAIIDPYTTLFLYTDGLTEAENTKHELFGSQRMMDVAKNLEDHGVETTLKAMYKAIHQFVGDSKQSDDLTMMAIRYTRQKYADRYQQSITLPNDIHTLPRLNTLVDQVCQQAKFDETLTMQMNLAIEEAVVNVMNYAYPQGVMGEVNIMATINDKRLKFIITDSGVPFDPTAKAETDTTLSAEERPIGGLGIFLVRQLMDSVNYERVDEQNILTLRKKLDTENLTQQQ